MKKYLFSFLVSCVAFGVLSGCGNNQAVAELEKNDANKAEAKVDPTAGSTQQPSQEQTQAAESAEGEQKTDIWTYYNDAMWSENFEGLKMEIQKVVVTDKGDTVPPNNAKLKSLVGIKFKMENTTAGIFTSYPDQAVLVTSTGEQIDMPNMLISDNIGGEIEEGVIKEGNIIWPLERGHAEDIKWIKMKWYAKAGASDNFDAKRQEYSVKLELKK